MPRSKAQDVIIEIMRKAGGELTGKTRLYKAFYFAHLLYSQEFPELLTAWPIVRMPQGPGIDRGDELLGEMIGKGYLTTEMNHDNFYPEHRYRLTDAGRTPEELPHEVGDIVQRVTDFVKSKSAAELSQLTHEQSRSWIEAKDGEQLNVDIDMIPDNEYNRRKEIIMNLDRQLGTTPGRSGCKRME